MNVRPEQLIRPELLRLSAYHVADARGYVKLDAMENPFVLPQALRAQMAEALANAALNRYPDPAAEALRQVVRRAFAIPDDLGILFGNGSDEIIQMLAMGLAKPGAVLLSVEPSFVMYRMIAEFVGMRYVGVPLREDFSLDEPAMLAAIAAHQPALVFLAYPNNPTGNVFDREAMARIIQASPGVVVVDEAYHAFTGGLSFLDEVVRHDNLLLMRTVSKLGLAGLRLGYLVGKPDWLAEFDKVRLPYNVNVLTQVAARFALEHHSVLEDQAATLVSERARMMERMRGMDGLQVYDSQANFLLLRVGDAPSVFAGIKARGVLIKNLHGGHPLLSGCLRVTVGAPEENDQFMAALAAELEARK